MGRTDNWGEEPLKRAKDLIKFLVSYDNSNRSNLSAEWRNKNSTRPELDIRTTLLDLAWLLYPERIKSNRSSEAKKEKPEIQSTIDRLKELGIVRENSTSSEKSQGIRCFTFILWHTSRVEHNLRQLKLAWGNRPKREKAKDEQTSSGSDSQKSDLAKKELDPRLERTIKTYLSKSFSADKFAELDQAGEPDTGEERRIPLKEVFIDLKVKPCERITPPDWRQEELTQSVSRVSSVDNERFFIEGSDSLFAMKCLLKEEWTKVVIIGGPGQGKSTLGQQLAQVYRAKWLEEPYKFVDQAEIKRIPFRIVLKYFAQWLVNKPDSDRLEAYLAKNIGDVASQRGEISSKNIHEIFECKECLLILDGLDEVVNPNLQEQMLSSIYTFLDWTKHLNINLKVVATSRPNLYEDQFDPKSFIHLELLPLSPEQVKKYANKWVARKDFPKEKQDRIMRTLEECQQDQRISTLLKTPLQVTIILLIIKNEGRPPGEREALFDEYWNTILKREKSKDKDIIKVDDTTLLDLNAYVGYLLHRRASNENVQSLLPEEEFKRSLIKFLQKKDSHSSEKDINLRVEQFVSDAKDRLVLIVSPRPGFFGFELRSFQEFFASVYLFKKRERFKHLKSILGSEHWLYVALILAGRIIRLLGEDANCIVRDVCRQVDQPIDEEVANHYLRPGAWFALEVAADGSLSKGYPDLQREAIDYGLEVLETGLTQGQQNKLGSLMGQLSEKDKRVLLRPALEAKLNSKELPETCWEIALNLYGKHFGSTPFFQNKIDGLLETQQNNLVLSGLDLGLRYKSEPFWMVERLQNYWSYWEKDIASVFFRSHQYAENLLSAWSVSEAEGKELAVTIFDSLWRYASVGSSKELVWNLLEPKSLSEQLILMLRCIRIIGSLRRKASTNHLTIKIGNNKPFLSEIRLLIRINYQSSIPSVSDDTNEMVKCLLQHSDLIPELRVSLWVIFYLTNKPNQANISSFLGSISSIEQNLALLRKFCFYSGLREAWPLLALVVERQKIEGKDAVNQLLPFLDGEAQISIAHQIVEIIQKYFKQSDEMQKQLLLIALRQQIGLDELLPELKQFAQAMDLTVDELVGAYIAVSSGYPGSEQHEYSIDYIQKLLMIAKDAIKQADKPKRVLWSILELPWPSDLAVIGQARQLLELILDNYSESSEFPTAELTAILFLKLLAYDTHIQEIAPRLFTILPLTELLDIRRPWPLRAVISEVSPKYLSVLQALTQHDEDLVRAGSTLLLKAIIGSIEQYPGSRKPELKELKNILIDSSLGMSFINDDRSKYRLIGITLLTLSSDYPVKDVKKYRDLILNNLKQTKTDEEEAAWNEFLQEIYMSEEKHLMWRKLLEEILRKPGSYSRSVLSIAMERYQEIAKTDQVIIPEID